MRLQHQHRRLRHQLHECAGAGIIGLLFVASLINYLDRATISVALPLISGQPERETKGALSAFLSYALMQVPIGWRNRYNLRWIDSLLFALWSFVLASRGLAGSLARIAFPASLGIGESGHLPGMTKRAY